MAQVVANLDARIAHLAGVRAATKGLGKQIEQRAKANLSAHREENDAKIVGRRQDTDWLIELVDDNAASIEFGRDAGVREDGRPYGAMEGTRILRDAI